MVDDYIIFEKEKIDKIQEDLLEIVNDSTTPTGIYTRCSDTIEILDRGTIIKGGPEIFDRAGGHE